MSNIDNRSFWKNEDDEIRIGRVFLSVVFLLVILSIIFSSFVIIPAGNRGVVMQLGRVEGRILGEGFHPLMPYVESVIVTSVRTQKYEIVCTSATQDLLDVSTTVAVNYHLSPDSVNKVWQSLGANFEEKLIAPAVQEVVKANTAKFDAEKLITQRALIKEAIESALKERLIGRDIIIETISITDFKYPTIFNDAIVQKQTAIQLKLKAINDLERIKVEAEQKVAQSKGEAESMEIINQQLLKSPQYISYLAVNKWDGKLPYATSGVPLIQLPTTTPIA